MIEVNKIAIPFAKSGNKSVIYDTRQQGQAENEATWSTGFPPVTMIRKEDGGLPPTGLDFNGIFYDISSNIVFACMGGRYKFDAEYAEKIGGYPKGAILLNDKENMQYISNTDNNKTNFNTADASKLTDWSIISIADIDKLLAKKIDNADFSEAINKKANTSTSINAGNGLTGGGDLTTSRTLSLGTPSTISQNTKNSVTASSHTHEITKATTSQQGITQLTSTLSDREDLAATPKLVNDTKINLTNDISKKRDITDYDFNYGNIYITRESEDVEFVLRQVGGTGYLILNDKKQNKQISALRIRPEVSYDDIAVTSDIPSVPVDQVFAFDTATPPAGYIARNGQAIDKDTMPKLYARYGANMPDDRDRVLRMAGSLTGAAGSTQEDAMQNIKATIGGVVQTGIQRPFSYTGEQFRFSSVSSGGNIIESIDIDLSRTNRTATETRAKSRIVILCNKIQ